MSQRRNLLRIVNDSNKNLNVSNRRFRTLILKDFNKFILFERLTLATFSLLSYVKNDVKKEH